MSDTMAEPRVFLLVTRQPTGNELAEVSVVVLKTEYDVLLEKYEAAEAIVSALSRQSAPPKPSGCPTCRKCGCLFADDNPRTAGDWCYHCANERTPPAERRCPDCGASVPMIGKPAGGACKCGRFVWASEIVAPPTPAPVDEAAAFIEVVNKQVAYYWAVRKDEDVPAANTALLNAVRAYGRACASEKGEK